MVRCDEAGRDAEGLRYRIGVDFDFLRDEDRELLVQHVIKKETMRLGETRGKLPKNALSQSGSVPPDPSV